MSNTTDESENDTLSRNHSELSFSDDGSPGEMAGTGVVHKKGPWTAAEDAILVEYVRKHGEGNWNAVQKHSGLFRCGKSCRLRWANHLRPNLKKGTFTAEEERLIIEFHAKMGNKWARMAAHEVVQSNVSVPKNQASSRLHSGTLLMVIHGTGQVITLLTDAALPCWKQHTRDHFHSDPRTEHIATGQYKSSP